MKQVNKHHNKPMGDWELTISGLRRESSSHPEVSCRCASIFMSIQQHGRFDNFIVDF